MRSEYDFSDSVANPYPKQSRKTITIQINVSTVDYFKQLANKTGVPYQNLINLYLTQAAQEGKVLQFI